MFPETLKPACTVLMNLCPCPWQVRFMGGRNSCTYTFSTMSRHSGAETKKRLSKKPHNTTILGQTFLLMWLMECIKFSDAIILPFHSVIFGETLLGGYNQVSLDISPCARVWCQGYRSNRELVVPKMRSSYLELLPYSKVPVLTSVSHSPPPELYLLQR